MMKYERLINGTSSFITHQSYFSPIASKDSHG